MGGGNLLIFKQLQPKRSLLSPETLCMLGLQMLSISEFVFLIVFLIIFVMVFVKKTAAKIIYFFLKSIKIITSLQCNK